MENIEKKLALLLDLQGIDTGLDEIMNMRGMLPEEVAELERTLADTEEKLQNDQQAVENAEAEILSQRSRIKDLEALVQKYLDQQTNVRNNREYDAITKETELQKLEIQISEKKIKQGYQDIETHQTEIATNEEKITAYKTTLTKKQGELEKLMKASEKEEEKLTKKRQTLIKKLDEGSHRLYERIRQNVKNKLAVVNVTRGACGGCFNVIPSQRQVEIYERKRLVTCEHCGRVLAQVPELLALIEKKRQEAEEAS